MTLLNSVPILNFLFLANVIILLLTYIPYKIRILESMLILCSFSRKTLFPFCFYFLVIFFISSLRLHIFYARLTGVSATIGCKARHGTRRRRSNRLQNCRLAVRNWAVTPVVPIEATTTKDGSGC